MTGAVWLAWLPIAAVASAVAVGVGVSWMMRRRIPRARALCGCCDCELGRIYGGVCAHGLPEGKWCVRCQGEEA